MTIVLACFVVSDELLAIWKRTGLSNENACSQVTEMPE